MTKRAVIYARYSSSKQTQQSIEGQLRDCHAWCERNGYEVVHEYCDREVSGRTDQRPEFQNMVASAGESDIVLVWMLDRFARNQYDAAVYRHDLAKKGVKVVSAMENIPDDATGIMLTALLDGMAAMESAKNSERTKRGMRESALKCQWNGNRVYGYAVDPITKRYVVDEAQAVNVRDAFALRLRGDSPNSISKELAQRGVKTYSGKPCAASMVENMLRNEKYIGVYTWGDVRIVDGMPAIIDRDVFDAVQTAPRAKRRKEETWHDFALAGKCKCVCGATASGRTAHGHGGVYHYYRCGDDCGVKAVRADWLEETIVSAVRTVLAGHDAERIAKSVVEYIEGSEGVARRKAAQDALADAERSIRNLMDTAEHIGWVEDMRERMDAAKDRRDRAKRDLKLFDETPTVTVDDVIELLRCGAAMDDATVLRAFVGAVVIDDKCIGVTLNYKDSNKKPAYLEVDGFAQTKYGSHGDELREPRVTVVDGVVWLLLPRVA